VFRIAHGLAAERSPLVRLHATQRSQSVSVPETGVTLLARRGSPGAARFFLQINIGRLSPQFCDNVKSVATAILGTDANRKVREKTGPGIERCIKLSSGLYLIDSAAVGVKDL
jgi:hypothetical protein